MNYSIKVDGLRMMNSTNTQLRRLEVISAIVKEIAKRQIPIELLKLKMVEWSRNLEINCTSYSEKNGRLTMAGKVTSAFSKYIILMKEMGIIQQLGSVISLTTTGHILYALKKDSVKLSDKITKKEKLFYLYILFSKDADYLLLVLDMIMDKPLLANQSKLQERFEINLLQRLDSKVLFSDRKTLMDLQEKKRIVLKEWRNAKSYSEHIIAPRLEWLIDLNFLRKEGNVYLYTSDGKSFIKSLLKIKENNEVSEINNDWLVENAFSSFKYLFSESTPMKSFEKLCDIEQNNLIGECLLISSSLFRSGSSLRIGLQPSLIFSSIHSFYKEGVVLEFNQLVNKLKQVFIYNGKQYQIKNAARTTEGYITIKINN